LLRWQGAMEARAERRLEFLVFLPIQRLTCCPCPAAAGGASRPVRPPTALRRGGAGEIMRREQGRVRREMCLDRRGRREMEMTSRTC
jgi:hypothetical protein